MLNETGGPVLYCVADVGTLETCGRYELVRRIAVGGMAEIYLSRETGLAGFERLVIVKRILPNLAADTDFIDMFLDEARLAARLSHPNIVHIYELDEQDGTYFIAMEYVPGGDLHEMLGRRRGQLLPLGDALHVISEICAGLQFAHSLAGNDGNPLGVVHRDVTPKNVLLSVDGVVKVMDFGIAKARAKLSVTRPGDIKGTFSYMAPEQARGETVDRRADIYAVGALLYRLVCGTPAYPQSGNALLAAVRAGQFSRPRKVNPEVPSVVEEVILRAMSVDPRARYATCGAMRRDLAEAARALGLHADSETLALLVREAFPRVPGATAPLDAAPEPFIDNSTAIETPLRAALAPAGPDESTGLVAMDDFDIVGSEALPNGPFVSEGSVDSPLAMDPTDMVVLPDLDADPTRVAPPPSRGGQATPMSLADLSVRTMDPASGLPSLDDEVEYEDQPTNVVDLDGGDPTRALRTPRPGPSAVGPVGPRAPVASSPIPLPPPEPRVLVGPATPTATPIVAGGRRPSRRKSRRGVLLLVLAFLLGGSMIAAAVLLTVMPSPTRNAIAAIDEPPERLAVPDVDPEPPRVEEPRPEAETLPDPVGEDPTGEPEPATAEPMDPAADPPGSKAPAGRPATVAPAPVVKSAPRKRTEPARPVTKAAASSGGGSTPLSGGVGAGEDRAVKTSGGTGFLTVLTTPYSKVYLGARLLGNTPMAKREVPAGRHRVKLVNPDLPPRVVSVDVKAGEVTRVRESL